MKYLHTMVRVSGLEASLAFYGLLGLREIRRMDHEAGRFTLIFLAAPGDEDAQVELTFNWDTEVYTGGRNFGVRITRCARPRWRCGRPRTGRPRR